MAVMASTGRGLPLIDLQREVREIIKASPRVVIRLHDVVEDDAR